MRKHFFTLFILSIITSYNLNILPTFAAGADKRSRNTRCTMPLSRISDDTLITFIAAKMNKEDGVGFFRWDATRLVEDINPIKLFDDIKDSERIQYFYGRNHKSLRISSSVMLSSELGHLVNVVQHIETLFKRSFPEEKLVVANAGLLKTDHSNLAPNQHPNINSSWITVTIPLIGLGTRYYPEGTITKMLSSRTKQALAFNGAWRGTSLVHAATQVMGQRLLLKIMLQPKEETHQGRSFKPTRFSDPH